MKKKTDQSEDEYYTSKGWFNCLKPITLKLIEIGLLKNNLEPIRCLNCLNDTFVEGEGEYEDVYGTGITMKTGYDWKCSECDHVMGHMSHGNWMEIPIPFLNVEL